MLLTKDFWLYSGILFLSIICIKLAIDLFTDSPKNKDSSSKNKPKQTSGFSLYMKDLFVFFLVIFSLILIVGVCLLRLADEKRILVPVLELDVTNFIKFYSKFSLTWISFIVSVAIIVFIAVLSFNLKNIKHNGKIKIPEKRTFAGTGHPLNPGCPPLDLLDNLSQQSYTQQGEELKDELLRCLNEYDLTFLSLKNIDSGPAVTRFTFSMAPGGKVTAITKVQNEMAMFLERESLSIKPSKEGLVIEMPNREREKVPIRNVLEKFRQISSGNPLELPLGVTVSGEILPFRLDKAPHGIVAGQTGSGKSVCINVILCNVLLNATPEQVKLILVDPKVVELSCYNGIPHLLSPVITDPRKAAQMLDWALKEMSNRYNLFADKGVRDISAFNERFSNNKLPSIVIVIDELADLLMVADSIKSKSGSDDSSTPDVESSICRLAQMGRAAGIHLICGTQRPTVDVITGTIKANIPCRIAFAVASQVDSRTILDSAGAEKLLGEGDGLLLTTQSRVPIRFQGAFISDDEVERVVSWWIDRGPKVVYNEELKSIKSTISILDQIKPVSSFHTAVSINSFSAAAPVVDEVAAAAPKLKIMIPDQQSISRKDPDDKYYVKFKSYIAELALSDDEEIFLPTTRELPDILGFSKTYVLEYLKSLSDEEWIKKVGDSARTSKYTIIISQEDAFDWLKNNKNS